MAKICPSCGYEAQDNEKFCTSCGTKLDIPETRVETAAPEAAPPAEPVIQEEPAVVNTAQPEPMVQPDPVQPEYVQPAQYGAVQNNIPQNNFSQNNIPQNNYPQNYYPQNDPPQYGGAQYTDPQYNAPQYSNFNYNAPQYGAAPPKKKNTVLIVAIIVAAVVLVVGVIALIISNSGTKSGSGSNNGNTGIVNMTGDLDGEYMLTGMAIEGQDYSSVLNLLENEYSMTIKGNSCTLVMDDETVNLKVDQSKQILYSDGIEENIEFSVNGDSIIIELDGTSMTFTKK